MKMGIKAEIYNNLYNTLLPSRWGGQSFSPVCQSVTKFCTFFLQFKREIHQHCMLFFFLLQFEALHIIAAIFERIKVVSFSKAFHLQLLHLKGAVVAAIVW
jgi:hypothetical protein